MKIKCEYCGAIFDDKDNIVCPSCGAEYSTNNFRNKAQEYQDQKERLYIEQQKEKIEQQKLNRQFLESQLENQRRRNKYAANAQKFANTTRKGCGTILIVFAILMAFVIAVCVKIAIDDEFGNHSSISEKVTEEETTEAPISVAEGNFGEDIYNGRYIIKVDKIQKTSAYPWNASVGHTCVLIHVLYTNKMLYRCGEPGNVYTNVIADGIAQKEFYLPSGYKGFPNAVQKGLTVEGWFKYEIPDNAEKMEFRFGDYAICHFTWDDVIDGPSD